jgi:hypothetical protein
LPCFGASPGMSAVEWPNDGYLLARMIHESS